MTDTTLYIEDCMKEALEGMRASIGRNEPT
jgi:hypothetical protein